jgi:hypothetical protein
MTSDPLYPWVEILVRLLGIVLAAAIVRSVVCRIKEGSFSFYGTDVHRKKNPISFWSMVMVALVGAGWLILLAIE